MQRAKDSIRIESIVRFVFSIDDVIRTRFAISPMFELTRSLLALRDPSYASLHLPWLRTLSGRMQGIELERAVVLLPERGFTPDFLAPPPTGPLGGIEEDLAALRATPTAQIRNDMRLFGSQHTKLAELVDRWMAYPRREVRRLADQLEAYWERGLEPVWPRVRAFLDADITHRARRQADGGPAALFADLADGVRWADRSLSVTTPRHEATIELAGRGLVLMPSAFAAVRPVVIDRAPWQPTLIYPARGVATLWQDASPAPDGLVRLLGATRAAVLTDLAAPRSTTEVSERQAISPAGASHHLAALRDAGLLTACRAGRSVLYVRTALGDALVAA